jgi:hypothetical protein
MKYEDGRFVLVEGGRLADEEVDLLRRAAADPAALERAIGGLRARGLRVKLIDDPAPKSPGDEEAEVVPEARDLPTIRWLRRRGGEVVLQRLARIFGADEPYVRYDWRDVNVVDEENDGDPESTE